jgi:hypothetical protein
MSTEYGRNAASLELDGEYADELRAANRKATLQFKGELPVDDWTPGDSSHPALTAEAVLRLNAEHDAAQAAESGSDDA